MRKTIWLTVLACALSLSSCAETGEEAERIASSKEESAVDAEAESSEEESAVDAEAESFKEESAAESGKAYLADFDMHPLYAAFLRNELSVVNPFAAENGELTFFDEKNYESEAIFENARKSFSLVDVNHDGNPELIFKISDSPSKLMYILGVWDNELICYDIFETHTSHMDFFLYDNGNVSWGQNYDGDEEVFYTYTDDGKARELIHFIREDANADSERYYDYYYFDGKEDSKYDLQSNEEYEELTASYESGWPKWYDCENFMDIPQDRDP